MNDIIRNSMEPTLDYDQFFTWLLDEELCDENTKALNVAEVIPHVKGERSHVSNSTLDSFIRQTNVKYFGQESNVLMGDFVELKTSVGDKSSFLRFFVNDLYGIYKAEGKEGVSGAILDNCAYANSIEARASRVIDDMQSYETIKDKLIIRPLNFNLNKTMLEGMTYRVFGDIALVLYAVVFDDTDALNTVKVPREICDQWDVDEDTIFSETMASTNSFAVPQLFRNILDFDNCDSIMEKDYTGTLEESAIPLVTTNRKTNGAIALFYDGVCEKIAEMYGGSFYVAFTSIHEAMCHKKGSIDVESIRRHLNATNKTFGPKETLTNEVWFYDAENKRFGTV